MLALDEEQLRSLTALLLDGCRSDAGADQTSGDAPLSSGASLAETAGDARIRGRPSAESREGILGFSR
jgi:hypothetical protein